MTGPFIIRTPRLELIAGDQAMAMAEMTNIGKLSALLQAEFLYGWPPPENTHETMEWFLNRIIDNPDEKGWLIWYFVSDENNKRTVIGNGGFTGCPDINGTLECGYSILPDAHQKGYASEALYGLVNWAFKEAVVKKIIGRTNESNMSSRKVLEYNRFELDKHSVHSAKMKYELTRKRWLAKDA